MAFSSDAFTDTSGLDLVSHVETGTGGSWTLHSSFSTSQFMISDANRCRMNSTNTGVAYTSESPASADYTVTADLLVKSNTGTMGVVGRQNTASKNAYYMRYRLGVTLWELCKDVAGVTTVLASASATLTVSNTYTVALIMVGTSITGQATGISDLTASDSSVAAAGQAGLRGASGSDTTGYHMDNFNASDPVSGVTYPQLERGQRGVNRGVC